MMKMLKCVALGASLLAWSAAHAVPTALNVEQVRAALEKAGYTAIHDVDYDNDDGYWEADAVNAKGQPVDVRVHPQTGAILRERLDDDSARHAPRAAAVQPAQAPVQPARGDAAQTLTAEQVRAALERAGYTAIHDVDYDDDGHWEADAVNARGQRVDVHVDARTGAVLRERLDH